MKSKKVRISLLLVIIIITMLLILYNKTYHIKVKIDDIYEIQVKTSDTDGLNSKIITNVDEIKEYMGKAQNIKFTHPHLNTGKGWVTLVDIKIKRKNGTEGTYRYTVLDDRINIGPFQYEIISQ